MLELIIAAIVGGMIATVVWDTLTNFVCRVVETVLPRRYGRKVSSFIRKVIGAVRRLAGFVDYAELAVSVLEYNGSLVTLETEEVHWSEVPQGVAHEIDRHGVYRYEHTL